MYTSRTIAFVLGSSHHGAMIVNRNDYCGSLNPNEGYGVGHQILNNSQFDAPEVNFVLALLQLRRQYFGDGVVGLDCGANIGVHTLEWSRTMQGWGRVVAFEAQERIFYALAGNVALNNCFNAEAKWSALGEECGTLMIPEPNYTVPASYGSLELRENEKNEFIGQKIDYENSELKSVAMVTLDSLGYQRVDLIKLDVEGMEISVLTGASETLKRCKPVLIIEIIKTSEEDLLDFLAEHGYFRVFPMGLNFLALHQDDPIISHLSMENNLLSII